MLVKKAEVLPVECVVRGYLAGSRLEGIQEDGHGLRHRAAGRACASRPRLEDPIFTPATKAETGHDENITFDRDGQIVGAETGRALRDPPSPSTAAAANCAGERGIIIADTKFEFGTCRGTS